MVKKLNLQEFLNLLQSGNIYSSCDKSDFAETQLIKPSSSEDSEKDDSIVEDEKVRLEQEILPNIQVSSSSYFSNEEVQSCSGVIWRRLQEGAKFQRTNPFRKCVYPKTRTNSIQLQARDERKSSKSFPIKLLLKELFNERHLFKRNSKTKVRVL